MSADRAEKDRKHHDVEAEAEFQRAAVAAQHRVEAAFQHAADAAAIIVAVAAGMRDASIGVRVSETKVDARIETVTTMANSLKILPMTPPISSTGMNTATSEIEIAMMVKPISREPLSAASNGLSSLFLGVADDVFQHDDRVVDDEADRQRQRHQRNIVDGKAEQVHHGERRNQRDRHGERRDQRRP